MIHSKDDGLEILLGSHATRIVFYVVFHCSEPLLRQMGSILREREESFSGCDGLYAYNLLESGIAVGTSPRERVHAE